MANHEILDISVVLEKLGAARIEMKEADQELRRSQSRELNARNGLDTAQRGLDRWYELQKKDAPTYSEWAKNVKP